MLFAAKVVQNRGMARFATGQQKPVGSGRKRGTPNRRHTVLVEALEAIDFSIPERLVELLPKLTPEKQADVLLDMMSYVFPKRKSLELSGQIEPANRPQVIVTIPDNGRSVRQIDSK